MELQAVQFNGIQLSLKSDGDRNAIKWDQYWNHYTHSYEKEAFYNNLTSKHNSSLKRFGIVWEKYQPCQLTLLP